MFARGLEPEQKKLSIIFSFVGCWVLYAVLYTFLKQNYQFYNGIFSGSLIVLLDVISLCYSVQLWINTKNKKSKLIFLLFAISCASAAIADAIYHILYNILGLSRYALSDFLISSYNAPTVFFLLFRLFIFLTISKTLLNIKTEKTYIIPALIVIFILSIGFALSSETIPPYALVTIYDQIDLILQSLGFSAAVLCLCIARNPGVFFVALAYVVDCIVSLTMNAKLLSQSYNISGFAETLWFLDSLIMVYGLVCFKKYRETFEEWTYDYRSVKTQLTLWCVVFCLFATSICTIFPEFITSNIQHKIAVVLMAFSFIFVIGSVIFCNILYQPLNKLITTIKNFLEGSKTPIFDKCNYKILEIKEVEKLLQKAINIMEEKNKAIETITKISAVTKHDIKSPLAALKIQLHLLEKKMPEEMQKSYQYLVMSYESIDSILKGFWEQEEKSKTCHEVFNTARINLQPIINHILETKKLLFPTISYSHTTEEQELYIDVNQEYLKRILSNLLNNSAEAIINSKNKENGRIEIGLKKEENKIVISISDNGCGMPQTLIDQIGIKEISTKETGKGIGLYTAIQYIKNWGGDYKITFSKEHLGTTISLYLPEAK